MGRYTLNRAAEFIQSELQGWEIIHSMLNNAGTPRWGSVFMPMGWIIWVNGKRAEGCLDSHDFLATLGDSLF